VPAGRQVLTNHGNIADSPLQTTYRLTCPEIG
jgi:hypothetical protein